MPDQFHVSAGKFHSHEQTVSFCDSFNTFDEALKAYDECSNYPWREMIYKNRIIEVM